MIPSTAPSPPPAGATPEEAHDLRLSQLIGLPGVKHSEFRAVRETLPFGLGVSTTGYQLLRVRESDDDPTRLMLFVEEGSGSTRRALVLGDKATRAVLRAAGRLLDTRSAEAKQREQARTKRDRKRRADHRAGRHDKRPVRACDACRDAAARAWWEGAS